MAWTYGYYHEPNSYYKLNNSTIQYSRYYATNRDTEIVDSWLRAYYNKKIESRNTIIKKTFSYVSEPNNPRLRDIYNQGLIPSGYYDCHFLKTEFCIERLRYV